MGGEDVADVARGIRIENGHFQEGGGTIRRGATRPHEGHETVYAGQYDPNISKMDMRVIGACCRTCFVLGTPQRRAA